jgi:hypothetical protein
VAHRSSLAAPELALPGVLRCSSSWAPSEGSGPISPHLRTWAHRTPKWGASCLGRGRVRRATATATATTTTTLPSQLATAIAQIEDSLRSTEAQSHEARHLRNLRSALLPLAGRLAVAVAKAAPIAPAFDPAELAATLRTAGADVDDLVAARQLAGSHARRILEVRERLGDAALLADRLSVAKRPRPQR